MHFLVAPLLLFLTISSLLTHDAMADQSQWQPLWPDTPPGVVVDSAAEGDRPEFRWNQVKSSVPNAAVVILPGGGYGYLALDHEGDQIAAWFQSMGISSLICMFFRAVAMGWDWQRMSTVRVNGRHFVSIGCKASA